jgi:hypothetical protein
MLNSFSFRIDFLRAFFFFFFSPRRRRHAHVRVAVSEDIRKRHVVACCFVLGVTSERSRCRMWTKNDRSKFCILCSTSTLRKKTSSLLLSSRCRHCRMLQRLSAWFGSESQVVVGRRHYRIPYAFCRLFSRSSLSSCM